MHKIFMDTRKLDAQARNNFDLSEDLMMENAAAALEAKILPHVFSEDGHYISRPAVLILAGSGNNGADGFALARRLIDHRIAVTVCEIDPPKSPMCIIQKNRAIKNGVQTNDAYQLDEYIESKSFDLRVIADCIFGSGFHGELPYHAAAVIEQVNQVTDAYKIACDIPTGIDMNGNISGLAFKADETVTMGALKYALFNDAAKDYCGKITCSNLGVSRCNFEHSAEIIPEALLLEENDLELPYRNKKQNVNKGSFGHTAVIAGEKEGAAIIAAEAALRTGSGLSTVVSSRTDIHIPYELMHSSALPENTTAAALGMGLGRNNPDAQKYIDCLIENPEIACVLDADIFYHPEIKTLLQARPRGTILTPHPKEFSALLENCGLGKYSVKEIQQKRLELSKEFCKSFPETVLILKGANVIISQKFTARPNVDSYINTFGTAALAKAGSGDVLTGIAASFLAQGQSPLEAAVNASLAHAIAGSRITPDYSLTPFKLIEEIEKLDQLN